LPVAVFDSARLDGAEKKLRQLAAYPKEAERLAEILAYYGIRFVVVEPLAGARIDGAAFWIGESPVLAVSARWDRIDAFWFTVMHEFMHIKNGDAYSADINLVRESEEGIMVAASEDTAEQRASDQAANLLVPRAELDSFIRRVSPLYASTRIVQFAHRIKMHPGIIVGQLQHRGELRYSSHRGFLVRLRKFVIETALTDGWGRSIGPTVI
jgi:HTH-type transcriptional regulator / antitoxin HigA